MELGKNLVQVTDFTKKTITKYDIPFPIVLAEKHPHIVNKIALIWGCKDFIDYAEGLIINPQNSDRIQRQGFSPEAFMEIMSLIDVHNERFPQFIIKNNDGFLKFK